MTKLAWFSVVSASAFILVTSWLWLESNRYSLIATAHEGGTAYKIDRKTGQVWWVLPGDEELIVADEPKSPDAKAIELAQHSRVLDATIAARDVVRNHLMKEKGTLRLFGWEARRIDADIFLVSFTYDKDDGKGKHGWIFEVLPSEEIIRYVLEDDGLMDRYDAQVTAILGPSKQ